ncbi:MAG: substrate-binding domain-containing protein [Gammaproteobacteria bacterium]|nr:substrate-binding domain-containing protein [Gammaproteobacteria bacterium]
MPGIPGPLCGIPKSPRGTRTESDPAAAGECQPLGIRRLRGRRTTDRPSRGHTAAFCATDLNAIGAIRAFRDRNIHVPADISVVGFDDLPSIAYATPALTTVRQDTAAAGHVLVETLLNLVRGNDVVSRLLPPELIVRQSSRQLRAEATAESRAGPRLTDTGRFDNAAPETRFNRR